MKEKGRQSIKFEKSPYVFSYASVAGKKEGQGPLGHYIDIIEKDALFGESSWEKAESEMQLVAAKKAIEKGKIKKEDIRFLVAGDLLGQLIATTFGIKNLEIPFLGVYGACSTMGESLAIASMLVEGGFADKVMALTSSHFAGAEKQFRFPLDYGSQRPLCSTWTVTGSGAVILSNEKNSKIGEKNIKITAVTIGKIIDYGVKDSMNMGACMAPAAADVISSNFKDLEQKSESYDKIITGDLGCVGAKILNDILENSNINLKEKYMDCGMEIYYRDIQDVGSGGSGCGCCAVTLAGYIFHKMKKGEWNKVLFVPTGALMSPVSFNEGESVPGIAHGIVFETEE